MRMRADCPACGLGADEFMDRRAFKQHVKWCTHFHAVHGYKCAVCGIKEEAFTSTKMFMDHILEHEITELISEVRKGLEVLGTNGVIGRSDYCKKDNSIPADTPKIKRLQQLLKWTSGLLKKHKLEVT